MSCELVTRQVVNSLWHQMKRKGSYLHPRQLSGSTTEICRNVYIGSCAAVFGVHVGSIAGVLKINLCDISSGEQTSILGPLCQTDVVLHVFRLLKLSFS